jgi:transposase
MSKLFKNFVGVDISKSWFDAAIIKAEEVSVVFHEQFSQTPKGYASLLQWLQQHAVSVHEDTLFCMEYTGIYNTGLVEFLVQQQANLWVEMPLRIKRAGGLERGSDDKSAAYKIACYALRYNDQAKLWKPANSGIEKIKHLIAQRDRILHAITNLTVPVEELKQSGLVAEAKMMQQLQRASLAALQKSKLRIEALINQSVKQDQALHTKIQLVQSVNGIGPVTATALLVYTNGFTAFDNAKQLACYCGVVPFNRTSGSSVRYKASVSPFANMKLKRLLHLCAMSAIQNDAEMKHYFERKVSEGKNKMSVINAVRNKLIHRVFAVLRDQRLFVDKCLKPCA